ncbi:MAG: peptide-methionine (S)-S-oxide reductase MsrA [Polyangiaceae bacterium]
MRFAPSLLALVMLSACQPSALSSTDTDPSAHAQRALVGSNPGNAGNGTPLTPAQGNSLAAFAAGCFWGVEDAFRHVPGVVATAVGYTGGSTSNPTYEVVCEHHSGHAETVLVEFDPSKISYEKLMAVFWEIHDPTTLNRQGPDVGDQYRSEIFTFSPEQTAAAQSSLENEKRRTRKNIVTRISQIGPFYKAEDYHQQYAEKTGSHGCPIGKVKRAL